MAVFDLHDQRATRAVAAPPDGADQIEVRVPADAAWFPALRVVAADLATRADFDLDAVSDLRMAVDEACAELVSAADPGAMLVCRFAIVGDRITVTATVPVTAPAGIPRDTFGWRVLTTLVDEADAFGDEAADASGDASASLTVRLRKQRRAGSS